MLGYGPGRMLVRLALTAIVAAIAWVTVGQSALDKINKSNARAGGARQGGLDHARDDGRAGRRLLRAGAWLADQALRRVEAGPLEGRRPRRLHPARAQQCREGAALRGAVRALGRRRRALPARAV